MRFLVVIAVMPLPDTTCDTQMEATNCLFNNSCSSITCPLPMGAGSVILTVEKCSDPVQVNLVVQNVDGVAIFQWLFNETETVPYRKGSLFIMISRNATDLNLTVSFRVQ